MRPPSSRADIVGAITGVLILILGIYTAFTQLSSRADIVVAIAVVLVLISGIDIASTQQRRAAFVNFVKAKWSSFLKKKFLVPNIATMITAIMIFVVFFLLYRLPDAGAIETIVKMEGAAIVKKQKTFLGTSLDNIIFAIIKSQKEPSSVLRQHY